MPSLRKRVTSYFRQLSFHNEPREKRLNVNENSFVTKYLQGQIKSKDGPWVISGKNPIDLPNFDLGSYDTGPETVIGCYTGPNGGLTTVKRTEKHLSTTDADIDFIDTQEDSAMIEIADKKRSPRRNHRLPIDNTTMVIKVGGQEYFVTSCKKQQPKSHSLGSLSDVHVGDEGVDANISVESVNGVEVNELKVCDLSNCDKNETKCDAKSGGKNCDLRQRYGSGSRQRADSNASRKNSSVELRKDKLDSNHSTVENHKDGLLRPRGNSSTNKRINLCNASGKGDDKTHVKNDHCRGNYAISKSKSEGNPFQDRKKGKIIRIMQRPTSTGSVPVDSPESGNTPPDDLLLPEEWNRKSDHIYGLSDSLYDRNQITKTKNGDPIADCFGIVARNDSAILAVADGVNWGEKASIAAKSAIHGCLHYLNKTIFNDVKVFENLIKSDSKDATKCETPLHETHISNTHEVFVCLLRAFNCAHDLILENQGMLTTLTVAVVLPLKRSNVKVETKETHQSGEPRKPTAHHKPAQQSHDTNEANIFVCCVCNVGDTLAYVYSQKYGIREITKGSHDIYCNRDMRDALGALGPVDGINPELSNLTLSITKIQKGDIIFVASDGLTDNFDPNVCKFTVNSNLNDPVKTKRPHSNQSSQRNKENKQPPKQQRHKVEEKHRRDLTKKVEEKSKPPVKPPRRNYTKHRDNISRSSEERSVRSESEENSVTRTKEDCLKAGRDKICSTEAVQCENVSKLQVDSSQAQSEAFSTTITIVGTLNANVDEPNSIIDDKNANTEELNVSLVNEFIRVNSVDESNSLAKCRLSLEPKPIRKQSSQIEPQNAASKTLSMNRKVELPSQQTTDSIAPKYSFLRSKTSLDLRPKMINRNEDGLPYVTPLQRYELTLLLMADVLKHGISGRESQCISAKKLCENLSRFTFSITAAKRHTLEDRDLYFDNQNGLLVEISAQEKKLRRKRGLERVQSLPGKLDHVTVVAFNVGNFSLFV